MKTLLHLREDEKGRVLELTAAGHMRQRLLDLGFVPGTKVLCTMKSPAGDPRAFAVRGAVIALRSKDADMVIICDEPSGGRCI